MTISCSPAIWPKLIVSFANSQKDFQIIPWASKRRKRSPTFHFLSFRSVALPLRHPRRLLRGLLLQLMPLCFQLPTYRLVLRLQLPQQGQMALFYGRAIAVTIARLTSMALIVAMLVTWVSIFAIVRPPVITATQQILLRQLPTHQPALREPLLLRPGSLGAAFSSTNPRWKFVWIWVDTRRLSASKKWRNPSVSITIENGDGRWGTSRWADKEGGIMNLGVIYYDFAHVMKLSMKIVQEQLHKQTSSSLCLCLCKPVAAYALFKKLHQFKHD